jgi:cytidylate kinase
MSVVAIDGPAGAGKSTVARAVADALGWDYVDTGAMYRALALAAVEHRVEPTDADALGGLAARVEIDVTGDRVWLEGRDVTARIRDPDVTGVVSEVSAHPGVRSVMARRQQDLAEQGNVVMEGRDTGTTIAPKAEVKVYLTASLRVRAQRRARQLGLPQTPSTIADVESALEARDRADSGRASSPLARADDALTIDSTDRDVGAVVALIVERVLGPVP